MSTHRSLVMVISVGTMIALAGMIGKRLWEKRRGYLGKPGASEPRNVCRLSNLTYSHLSEKNSLDLFLPMEEKTKQLIPDVPLLVFIHGGLWARGDKSDGYTLARYFASKRRMAVATVNYQLAEESHYNTVKHPIHTLDVADALKWLYNHAKEYKFNTERVYLIGHSIGAHMIGLFSLRQKSYSCGGLRVRGAIGLDGIYDTVLFHTNEPNWRSYIEYAMPEDKNLWESPQNCSNSDCESDEAQTPWPWLVLHSMEDKWVNVNQAENFARHLHRLGVTVELKKLNKGGSHDEVLQRIGDTSCQQESSTALIEEFISSIEAEVNWTPSFQS